MKSIEKLLAMLLATTLVFSIVTIASPSFSNSVAYADDAEEEEDEDNDNNGHGNESHGNDDDKDSDDNNSSHGSGSGTNDDDEDESKFERSLGSHSKAELEVDEDHVELTVEIEEEDLDDGSYDVIFSCTSPEISETFAGALEVEDGDGELEQDIALEEGAYAGCEVQAGSLSAQFPEFAISAHEQEDEDDDEHEDEQERENDDSKFTESLGENSKAKLEIEDDVDLEVEIEDGDLPDGLYNVTFSCTSPDVEETFANELEVEDGEGEMEAEILLANGTYAGCKVEVGTLSAAFPMFTIRAEEDDEHDDEEHDDDKDEKEHESKTKLKVDDDGVVEIKVELKNVNLTNGAYDVTFHCTDPALTMNLTDAFEVKDGKGKLEAEFGLGNGEYSGCHIELNDESVDSELLLASFDHFMVSIEQDGDEEEDDDDKNKGKSEEVKQKQKERKQALVSGITGHEIHQRHMKANPSSPGIYQPGANYTVVAIGTADDENTTATVALEAELGVWKSTPSLILLDVVGGTIEVGSQNYTLVIGYALYSINSDSLHIKALVVSEDNPDDILKLRLRGVAVGEGAEFPTEPGKSIDLEFGDDSNGSSKNYLNGWQLTLDGALTD